MMHHVKDNSFLNKYNAKEIAMAAEIYAEDIDKKNREDKKEMNQDSEEPEINNEEKYNTDSEESVTEDSEDN